MQENNENELSLDIFKKNGINNIYQNRYNPLRKNTFYKKFPYVNTMNNYENKKILNINQSEIKVNNIIKGDTHSYRNIFINRKANININNNNIIINDNIIGHKNEINLIYFTEKEGIENIFGEKFVENNQDNIDLIINGEEIQLIK